MTSPANPTLAPIELTREAAARVMERCAILAKITDSPGQILRTFLSASMDEVHRTMRPWMEAAGMTVSVDRAGNLRGVFAHSGDRKLPRLVIGSHLDTVPNAGAYDGVLGVLIGLALVEAIGEKRLAFAIEVIGFSDEEGTRFGTPFLGSRAVVGELTDRFLDCIDADGISVRRALKSFEETHPAPDPADLDANAAGYLEFHIEQGPVLESKRLALGVVDALVGQSRCRISFHGRAGHAGTTPMSLRQDALAAAAEWISRVETIAGSRENLVATVGQISAEPGGVNVIPGLVHCSLDVRHADDGIRESAVEEMLAAARSIGHRRGVHAETHQYHVQPAVRLDGELCAMALRAAASAGHPEMTMTSGAGHDVMVIAPHLPATLIFLRNPRGISHHPDEWVDQEDVAAAIHTGLYFLDEFERYIGVRASE